MLRGATLEFALTLSLVVLALFIMYLSVGGSRPTVGDPLTHPLAASTRSAA